MSAKPIVIHVLVVWPAGYDRSAEQESVEPKVVTFIEHSTDSVAYQACQRRVVAEEAFGHTTELVTVPVDSDRPDPAMLAIEQVMHEIRTAPTGGAQQVLRPGLTEARAVTVEDAATYLSVVHDIGTAPAGTDLDIVLLRLARRAEVGDKSAIFALSEFAAEVRRASEPVPTDVDPLTFTTVGGLA